MSKRMKVFLLFAAVIGWFGRDGARGQEAPPKPGITHNDWLTAATGTVTWTNKSVSTASWLTLSHHDPGTEDLMIQLDQVSKQTLTIKSGSVTVTIPLKELLDRLSITHRDVTAGYLTHPMAPPRDKNEGVFRVYDVRPLQLETDNVGAVICDPPMQSGELLGRTSPDTKYCGATGFPRPPMMDRGAKSTAKKPRLYRSVDPMTGKEHFGATKVKKSAPAATKSPLQGGQWRQQP